MKLPLTVPTLILPAVLLAGGSALLAQQPAAPPAVSRMATPATAPALGAMAPNFSAPAADTSGPRAAPITLRKLRGKVVVLAFYPKDRSSGCTAEMTEFRDDYAKLFGADVVVLPISLDDVQSHAGWARDMHFPFALVSDAGGKIAARYGSITPGRSVANRTVYVIAPDGRIAYRDLHFAALDQHSYDALAAAVRQVRKGT